MNLKEKRKIMKVGLAALTDTQRVVLASGKALAEELGLTPFEDTRPMQEITFSDSDKALAEELGLTQPSYLLPTNEIEFTEGQTALVATPHGTNVGVIKVEVREYLNKQRYTEYTLNDEVLFKKAERLREGEWVALFSPDLNIPVNSVLYVS